MSNFDSPSDPTMSRPSLRIYLDSLPGQGVPSSPIVSGGTENVRAERTRSDRQQRELDRLSGVAKAKTVDLPVGQIVPLLMHALESNRTWLKDFANDTVRIDADLYEVLLAYQQIIDRKVA
jgi:hypothetical protein